MGYSFGQEDPITKKGREGKGCPFFWVCGRWTGPSSKGWLSNWLFLWNLLKGDVFISDFAFSWAIFTHTFRLEKAALLMSFCLLWCLVSFHFGYCKVWLSVELPDELPSLYCCCYSFVCGSLLCIAADVNTPSTRSDRQKHWATNFVMSWMHSLWLSSHSSEG